MPRLTNTIAGTMCLLLLLLSLFTVAGDAFSADPDDETITEAAREALNRSEYEKAAELFEKSRMLKQTNEDIARAIYWEAFSRARMRQTHELKLAAELLSLEELQYADEETLAESEALAARIYGELAQRGETDAVREINQRATAEEQRTETRIAALQALLQMDPDRALPILEKIIKDDSPKNKELRRHAVMVACHEDSPKLHKLLLGMLDTEKDPEFLEEIAFCLAMNPSEGTIEKLMILFDKNHNSQLGEAIIISLSHMDNDENSDRIFQFLIKTAKDPKHNSDIRQHAIMSLGQYGKKPEIIDFLLGFSGPGEDPEIQEAVLMALAQLDMKAADDALMEIIRGENLNDEYKAQALYFLGSHGKLSVDFLRDIYLKSGADSEELKFQVWHLLSSHDDQDAALDTMLNFARNEKDAELKQEMVFWIGQFDDPRAADFLVEILQDEH